MHHFLVVYFINYRYQYILQSLCNLIQVSTILVICDTKQGVLNRQFTGYILADKIFYIDIEIYFSFKKKKVYINY